MPNKNLQYKKTNKQQKKKEIIDKLDFIKIKYFDFQKPFQENEKTNHRLVENTYKTHI